MTIPCSAQYSVLHYTRIANGLFRSRCLFLFFSRLGNMRAGS
ncbi:hypothetical protein CGRA01v4_06204 [Colletotrichum graminicola]|nr:hypothetical protein CGRA01v4_06204 [Colletotrichum graminicola]